MVVMGKSGMDAGLEQVRAGTVWHCMAFEREQSSKDRAEYARTEQQTRSRGIGLWIDPIPVPPWEYRNQAVINTSASLIVAQIDPPSIQRGAARRA